MNLADRHTTAMAMLMDFLEGYSAPRGLDDDAKEKHLRDMADSFTRKLPVTDAAQFAENIERTFTAVKDTHKSFAWPNQAEFVMAMPKGSSHAPNGKLETYRPIDQDIRIANGMNSGSSVPDRYVWGSGSLRLRYSGQVSDEIMDGYRKSSVAHFRKVYMAGADMMLLQAYGDIVVPYVAGKRQGAA